MTPTTKTPKNGTDPARSIDISTRGMIVSMHISRWKATKFDRAVTEKTNQSYEAADDAGKYRKQLVAKEALAKIQSAVSAARDEFERRTLPWYEDGQRIVLSSAYFDLVDAIEKKKAAFYAAVDEFFDGDGRRGSNKAYNDLAEVNRKRLGKMANDDDFPPADALREKFGFEFVGLPLPSRDDFRVGFSKDQMTEVLAHFDKMRNGVIRDAMLDVANRIKEVVGHMVERLRGFKFKENGRAENDFHNSLVENVSRLAGLLPSLNLTGDPRLDALAAEMTELTRYSRDELREDSGARNAIASQAEAILKKMSDFI